MIRVISSFADGPVNFHSTGPAEDQIQKLILSTDYASKHCKKLNSFSIKATGGLYLGGKLFIQLYCFLQVDGPIT